MMDLTNQRERMQCTVYVWGQILALGRLYGWEPAGTQAPREADDEERTGWDGNYVMNGGQIVAQADAAGLAHALESALDDIPDHYAATHKTVAGEIEGKPTRLVPAGAAMSPLEALSGQNKAAIRDFIRFCREGTFEIW